MKSGVILCNISSQSQTHPGRIQLRRVLLSPDGLPLADSQAETLVQYNGFVTITQEPDEDIADSSVTVTPDVEAWEAWKASQPPEPEPEPEPEYVTYSELAAAIREGVNSVS